MIIVYFDKNKKYLKKDGYIKYFNNCNSIVDIVKNIKDKSEKLHIICSDADILDFTFNDDEFEYEYERICLEEEITIESIIKDLTDLKNGIINHVAFKPLKKWSELLGDKVILTYNPFETYNRTHKFAFEPSDLTTLYEGLEKENKIPESLVFKMVMNCKVVI